jgi:DNA-binding response OmpR family regulator
MAKIVIVENDEDIAPLLQQLLELEGHSTVLIKDPGKAASTIRKERPALVYLDVRLTEDIDGFDVLEEIRAEKNEVPVLMCSGLDVEDECLRAGADAFMLKPFDFNDLLESVKRALGGAEL